MGRASESEDGSEEIPTEHYCVNFIELMIFKKSDVSEIIIIQFSSDESPEVEPTETLADTDNNDSGIVFLNSLLIFKNRNFRNNNYSVL